MTGQSRARKRKTAAVEPSTGRADPDFDGWLDVRLRTMYDSVLGESLPEEILKLLAQPKSPPES